MLYDNALLARAYLHGWQALGHERWRRVCDRHARLGAARDARAGGRLLLGPRRRLRGRGGPLLPLDPGRDPRRARRRRPGRARRRGDRLLRRHRGRATSRGETSSTSRAAPAAERPERLDAARRALRERRAERVWPSLDDKRLASWNALMIAALAEAGAVLGRDDHLDAARRCAEFVWTEMRTGDGRLRRSWKDGEARAGRLPGGLRVPGRGAADAVRGDLRGALVRRRAPDRRPDDRAVRRSRARRLLHHRPRPRAADRAPQGRRRPSDPIRQLVGRLRAAAPRRADRGARVRAPGGRRLPPRCTGRPPAILTPSPISCARWTSTSPR